MNGRHDFLFWYEEGIHHKKTQKENNITDALLKTLQESADTVTSDLVIDGFDVEIPSGLYEWEYTAQPVLSDDNINEWNLSPDNTYLVGISQAGKNIAEQAPHKDADPDNGPRPDGLLQLQPRNAKESSPISIFLEVKTGDEPLGEDEMGRYRGALALETPNYDDHGRGVEWLDVYRVLQASLERTAREPDNFLLREFTRYLAWFELEHTIAAHDGSYPKKLKITGYPVEDRNKLKLKFIWDREDGRNSQSPEFTAAELNTCLNQIPQDVRKETFVGGDLAELEAWARSEFGDAAVDSGQRIAVTPAEKDGAVVRYIDSDRIPGKQVAMIDTTTDVDTINKRHKALYFEGTNLKPIWAGESGRKNTRVPANLDPTAFQNIMAEINKTTRKNSFGRKTPDVASLWKGILND